MKITPSKIQLLSSDPKPIEDIDLKEYGIWAVYRLVVYGPYIDLLCIKMPPEEGTMIDIDRDSRVVRVHMYPSLQKDYDKPETLKPYIIKQLLLSGFIKSDDPDLQIVRIIDTSRKNSPVVRVLSGFWNDIQIYSRLFLGDDIGREYAYAMLNNGVNFVKPLSMSDFDFANIQERTKADIATWATLREKLPWMLSTVFEFTGVGDTDYEMDYRFSVLMGQPLMIENVENLVKEI